MCVMTSRNRHLLLGFLGRSTTWNRTQRSIIEELLQITLTVSRYLEVTRLQRGTHHHQLQVRALRQDLLQKVQYALIR